MTKQSVAAIVATLGNSDCHVILRGGNSGPNFGREQVKDVADTLTAAVEAAEAAPLPNPDDLLQDVYVGGA